MELRTIHSVVNERIGKINSNDSIEFVKNRYDILSPFGIFGMLATVYYLSFEREKFLSNMETPINLIVWILLVSYPIIRYWISFHVYRLNAEGITLKNSGMLRWSDIKAVAVDDNYEEQKDQETPVYRLELTIMTTSHETKTIKFNNYTIANKELREKLKPFLSKDLKMKDVLVKIFMAFYEKHKSPPGK